jgi:hypothetical protein
VAIESLVLVGTSVTASVAAVGAVLRQWRSDRNKPVADAATADKAKAEEEHLRATVKSMAEETNRSRDYRVWALEGYIDLDRVWHREMIKLLEDLISQLRLELAQTGRELPDIAIPPPPEIPGPLHG